MTVSQKDFWNRFAPRYDSHVMSRQCALIAPRLVDEIGEVNRVLDVACGTGTLAVLLAAKVERVDAIDLAPRMTDLTLEKLREAGLTNVHVKVQSAEELSFPDATFDVVVLSNLLHLLDEPKRALGEAKRVLKPGGRLFAPTYLHGENFKAAFLSRLSGLLFGLTAASRWNLTDFLGVVRNVGFTVISDDIVPLKMPLAFVVAQR